MVVQSHQVKVLQAQPGLAWVRCEQLGGGVVISTESQTVRGISRNAGLGWSVLLSSITNSGVLGGLELELEKPRMNKVINCIFSSFLTMLKHCFFFFFLTKGKISVIKE